MLTRFQEDDKESTLRRSALRWPVLIIAFVLSLPSLTGCAIDKGTALASDFEEAWAGTPDVAKIHTTKNNTLPFKGSSTGTLILKDGTSADRVTKLVGEMRSTSTVTPRSAVGSRRTESPSPLSRTRGAPERSWRCGGH